MASLLSITDKIQTWIDKINAILTLNTVDGNFRIEDINNLYVDISAGIMRKGSVVVTVNSESFTLLANSTSIIGVDTINNILESHEISVVPTDDFIPIWRFVTTTEIIDTSDLRTWVIA